MKFIYIDESGTGNEPFAVMIGIIADSFRMRPTKSDWKKFLKDLSVRCGKNFEEIHTKELYRGNGKWYGVDSNIRNQAIDDIIQWIKGRNHTLVYSSVNKELYHNNFKNETHSSDIKSLWQLMAFHITLALQKAHQSYKKNKGNSILIFDNKVTDQKSFTCLLLNSPDWSDTYYSRKTKDEKLNQIIDVPHFVDSKQVELIQLADFCCYFLRLYLEILYKKTKPEYDTELEYLEKRVNEILSISIPKSHIYPQKGRCQSADLFYKYGVDKLKE
jgi:hypothetical protein